MNGDSFEEIVIDEVPASQRASMKELLAKVKVLEAELSVAKINIDILTSERDIQKMYVDEVVDVMELHWVPPNAHFTLRFRDFVGYMARSASNAMREVDRVAPPIELAKWLRAFLKEGVGHKDNQLAFKQIKGAPSITLGVLRSWARRLPKDG